MKTCSQCKQQLELNAFNKNKAKKDGYNNFCRQCSSIASSNHYKNNRAQRIEYQKKRKELLKDIASSFVNSLKTKCYYCNESTPCCLDYHHVNPDNKSYEVSAMVHFGYSVQDIQAEIDKCVLVCANCHRKIHHRLV